MKSKNTDHVDGISHIWKMLLKKSENIIQILKTMAEAKLKSGSNK